MPKKKKAKENSTDFKFDYRFTPKPYFSAPTVSPGPSPVSSQTSLNKTNFAANKRTSNIQRSSNNATFNADTWQNHQRQRNYGYNRHITTYAKAATQQSSKGPEPKPSPIEVAVSPEEVSNTAASASAKDQATIKKMFEEMFRGRVDPSVIDMVLEDVNWNENEALDVLSQLAPQDNSHLHATLTADASAGGFGAITPDHNLTPTAPTLSYCSSITSLDEFGMEYCRDVTQRNLSQVADVLRNGPDDINDLDRQRLARSRAATPKTLFRNGAMTLKNITLGSTESLESNRSHYSQEPSGLTYATSSLSREGTPKKSQFEKTMSLHDISSADDCGITISVPSDPSPTDIDSARSDPGMIESLLIPLEHHGDIVLEKGTYDNLVCKPETAEQADTGPLTHSASISDYSEALSSLITQLNTEVARKVPRDDSSDVGFAATAGPDSSVLQAAPLADAISTSPKSEKENRYPYNGILTSGVAVPTAFESARPKKPKVLSPHADADEATALLFEAAKSSEKVMFIMRGVPGSGKTSLGRQLAGTEGQLFTADDYFVGPSGEYRWDRNQLGDAHAWNQKRVHKAAEAGISPIVADNTNLEAWEMEPYIKVCLQHGYRPLLAEPSTPWRYKAKELARKNVHGVTYSAIKLMLERFEHTVTEQQLIDKVTRKDPTLQPMAEQLKATASQKLSRKRQTSKTIRRNKQHDTIEKFKDKKVEELTSLQSQPVPSRLHENGEDDGHGETEIMYPSITSMSGLKRKSTIKVLNCERPRIKHSESGGITAKTKAQHKVSNTSKTLIADATSTVLKGADTGESVQSESVVDISVTVVNNIGLVDNAASSLYTTQDTDEVKVTPIVENQVLTSPILDKSVSVDSGLTKSASKPIDQLPTSVSLQDQSGTSITHLDQSATSSSLTDQSTPTKDAAVNQLNTSTYWEDVTSPVRGSSTLPRPSSRSSSSAEGVMSHSASLPRPKDRSKARKGSAKKSTSTSILHVDSVLRERWMSNDWAAPPYPMASSASGTLEPPPPYEEHDVATSADETRYLVKTKDGSTLTEPIDYAMAYKAMQYNHQLPQGWVLLSGHSKEPYTLPADVVFPKSSVVTYDKGTMIAEGDVPPSRSSSTEDLSPSSRQSQLERLHACFPQQSKEQLADFLDLCKGDETWATNLLLDSNNVSLPKSKRSMAGALSIADINKKWKTKYKVGKTAFVKRFSQAIVPVTNCLGRQGAQRRPAYANFSQGTIGLSLTNEQAHSLHAMFGDAEAEPPSYPAEVVVDVPRWLAHRIYRSMISTSSQASAAIDTETPGQVQHRDTLDGAANSPPQRPPRRIRTFSSRPHTACDTDQPPSPHMENDLGDVAAAPSAEQSTALCNGETTATDSLTEVGLLGADNGGESGATGAQTTSSHADEELARKLLTEDLLGMINDRQRSSADKVSIIADEQYARSLMVEEINGSRQIKHGQPDLSSKLKHQKLYELYPAVDKIFLDEVFKTCGYNLQQAVQFLSDHQSEGSPMRHSSEASWQAFPGATNGLMGSRGSTPLREPAHGRSPAGSRGSTPARDTSYTHPEPEDDQWFDIDEYAANADYAEYRAEAQLHQRLRKEYLDKAALANSKRRYDVSLHYSREAEKQFQKYKEANFAAATKIFRVRNATGNKEEVDLHGLHPDEAVLLLEELVKMKRREGGSKHLHIITGRGNRSKGGLPRVKSAVERYLAKNRIHYLVENPGMLRITL